MPSRSWTDDLPKCHSTSVAFFHPAKELQTEEYLDSNNFRCFYCQVEDDTCLYGIFDAHNGNETAHFVLQRLAAEILLGQLSDKYSDEEIKEVLRNAFLSVENAYIESIDGLVAERTSLQFELPEGLSPEKLSQKCGDIWEKLKCIDERLSVGATSVVALIHMGKLYVANVGNSRALLCKTDDNCVLRVVQLSVDHSLDNEDELLRLTHLGLEINKLRQAEVLGNQSSTRCLGNYLVKGLYRAFPDMRTATSEPVIAIPEVHGPILLDQSCRFLVLVSDGLYKNLQESTDTEQVNKRFAQMIVEQFRTQVSLKAVCQAVVDQIMTIYHEYCMQNSIIPRTNNRNTLLIRNFNFQLPNAPIVRSPLFTRQNLNTQSNNAKKKPNNNSETNQSATLVVPRKKEVANNVSPENSQNNATVRFNPVIESHALHDESEFDSYTNGSTESANILHGTNLSTSPNQTGDNFLSTITSQFTQGTDFTRSSSNTDSSSDMYPNNNRILYDKNRKIEAYVDFSQYYENYERAKLNGTLPSSLAD